MEDSTSSPEEEQTRGGVNGILVMCNVLITVNNILAE